MLRNDKSSIPSFLCTLKNIPSKYHIYTCNYILTFLFIDPKPNSIIYLEEKFIRCPICLREVFNPIKSNNCRHIFCFDCLTKWLKQKPICPVCRAYIDKYSKVDLQNFEYFDQLSEFANCYGDDNN